MDTHEVDDGWGEESDEPLPPSSRRPPPPPRSTRPEPETRLSASEGEVIAVDPETIDSAVLVPEPDAPSATPSAPTAPQGDGPTVPLDAQPTMPMPLAVAAQAAQAQVAGAPPPASYPTVASPAAPVSPPVALGAPPPGAIPVAPPGPGDAGPSGPGRGALTVVLGLVLGAGWLIAAVLLLQPIVAPEQGEDVEATGIAAAAAVAIQAVATHRRGQQEQADAGDPEALSKLEALPPGERTVGEALALARGRRAEKLGKLAAVQQEIQARPELAKDPKVLGKLHRQAYDAQLTEEALRVMAELPGEAGADLLYAVWTHTNQRTPTTTLARDLLLTQTVAAKASPALGVVLALRAAEDCETRKKLLADAQDHGDARALRQLNLLKLKTGCGPNKRADCHPCLRAGTALNDAIKAVVARRPPRY